MINNIVKRMDTMLKTPESILCTQDEELKRENDEIYFIAKGKCSVKIRDKFKDRFEEMQVRILEPGDHFGEISMLYQCSRSATVMASHYCTCARLHRNDYQELLQQYQELNDLLKEHIRIYDDPLKIFLELSLNQIDYFKGLQ